MTDDEKQTQFKFSWGYERNIGPKRDEIIQRQLSHFYKADNELALSVAKD